MVNDELKNNRALQDRLRRSIRDHVSAFWPNSVLSEAAWQKGPIEDNIPGFRILQLESREPTRPFLYATDGCFTSEPTAHTKHEFFLISPTKDDQHLETLTMLANFHSDERFKVDVGTVLNIVSPWIDDSKCNHLLISVPYPYGPKLEWLNLKDVCVRFLWALPITEREAAFADLHGPEALEQKFDAVKLDYLDISRPSVV